MKRNAIIRIVIWSVVIVLLVGILGTVLVQRNNRGLHRAAQGKLTEATMSYETSPNSTSGTAIEDPMVSTTVPEIAVSSPAKTFPEVEIAWVAGNITVEAADVDDIQVFETEVSDSKYVMQVKRSNKKLTIAFCDEDELDWNFGVRINDIITKDLTILVPRNWSLGSLEVDAAAAALDVRNLVIREVEFDGANGACDFENCVVDQLDLDTASGDITFTGTLQVLDCDAASASVRATLDNVPSRIDMDSMSGDLELTLPDWAGFTLSMDAMSSDFVSDFDTTVRNDSYVCGDGSCRISMDAMSGDVYIHKNADAAAVPEATTTP